MPAAEKSIRQRAPFGSSVVALVTPFSRGVLDRPALEQLVRWHRSSGTDAVLIGGTTGEGATLEDDELFQATELALVAADGQMKVLSGSGTNATQSSIRRSRLAAAAGADGLLVVTPYYNKPNPDGVFAHFEKIAEAVTLPIMAYNVPSRTGLDLSVEVLDRLADLPALVALKEANPDQHKVLRLVKALGSRMVVYSGDDFTVLPTLCCGGVGAVSVVGNVVPERLVALITAFDMGKLSKALEIQLSLLDLCQAMFWETNPVPVKAALHLLGRIGPELRLPLAPLSASRIGPLKTLLEQEIGNLP